MVTITTPNKQFSGERAGLTFSNGKAVAESITGLQRRAFARLGYTVEGDEPEQPATLNDHTVAQLRELAQREGIDLTGASKKAEIIAAIEAARNPQPPAPAVVTDTPPPADNPADREVTGIAGAAAGDEDGGGEGNADS